MIDMRVPWFFEFDAADSARRSLPLHQFSIPLRLYPVHDSPLTVDVARLTTPRRALEIGILLIVRMTLQTMRFISIPDATYELIGVESF
ncbi:hypothetical protein [Streptomyces asiaticus]